MKNFILIATALLILLCGTVYAKERVVGKFQDSPQSPLFELVQDDKGDMWLRSSMKPFLEKNSHRLLAERAAQVVIMAQVVKIQKQPEIIITEKGKTIHYDGVVKGINTFINDGYVWLNLMNITVE